MTCEDKQKLFNEKFGEVQGTLQEELSAITRDTEARAQDITSDFEAQNDLAEGIGAVAGTAIGGVVGGAPGAVIGGTVGRLIGTLFTLEVGMHRETFVFDVPQVRMETQDFSFDLPTVVMRDSDIIFDIPTIEIRRTEGPPIPHTTIRMETRCVNIIGKDFCTDVPVTVIEWEKTYLDLPTSVMTPQRIVMGLPKIEIRRQEFKIDVPAISMEPTEISADIPYITLRFMQDAGKRTAALAAALAQSAQDAVIQKQIAYKERVRTEVVPLATDMFACYRQQISNGRNAVMTRFAGEIQTLQNAVTAIAAKGVPQDNLEFVHAQTELDAALNKQRQALNPLDDALKKFDEGSKTALQQLLGDNKSFTPASGGLPSCSVPKGVATRGVPGLVSISTADARKGLYLTIGLNSIDPTAYGGPGALAACENDARDMAEIARTAGFTGKTLLTREATSSAVLSELKKVASTLQSGDIFLLTYSGHGGQVGDINGDEEDFLDETWCLYDRQLLDDELYAMWAKFRPGVRIFVLSDSCHSGTVTKALFSAKYQRGLRRSSPEDMALAFEMGNASLATQENLANTRVKSLPFDRAWANYTNNQGVYDSVQILSGERRNIEATMGASVILISGCQDHELSLDGPVNGMFTRSLKQTWGSGNFYGSYKAFWQAISANGMPSDQNPNYFMVGASNLTFEAQRPFTI